MSALNIIYSYTIVIYIMKKDSYTEEKMAKSTEQIIKASMKIFIKAKLAKKTIQ